MKVLLATDGSQHAEQAAAFLSRLPHAERLDLTVMTNIFVPTPSASTGTTAWLPEFREQQQQAAEAHFEAVARMFEGANAAVTHYIGDGHIGHSIVEKAKEMEADLIVVGAKGHSTIDRILLGSVSDHVATEATCSVLIVRPSGDDAKDQLNLTVTSAPDTPSEPMVRPFRAFHFGESVTGHVLSVVPVIRTFRQDLLPAVALNRAAERSHAREHAEQVAADLRKEDVDLSPQAIEAAHVGEGVVDFLHKHGSDLVLVGDSHRSAISRLALGSTSRYVLRHAPCSVWIARDPQAG
jgi:nucleotide-binding universal stress UspA family protein